jgi:hypothetical protein
MTKKMHKEPQDSDGDLHQTQASDPQIQKSPVSEKFEVVYEKCNPTDRLKPHIEIWQNHYSCRRGKMFNIQGKNIEYCWPVGSPLEACLQGKVDEVFMQPRTQIEYQLKGRAQNFNKIWPIPGVANPTEKDIYWAMQDPFSLSDLKEAACYLVIGKTGSGKTTMCNAIANWAWDTKYQDKDRYKLIHDELSVNGMDKYLGCSVTYRINAYFLNVTNNKFKGKKIIIIDTPGFAGKFHSYPYFYL